MKKLMIIIAISVSCTTFAQQQPKVDNTKSAKLEKSVQCSAKTKVGQRCKKMTK